MNCFTIFVITKSFVMDINTLSPIDSSDIWDDIRPYRDAEIGAAMARVASDKDFATIMNFVYGPSVDLAAKQREFCNYKRVSEFQIGFMFDAINSIASKTITEFTCSGLEKLEKGKGYLFISNHRDILLDAALLQIALYNSGLECSEITFGNNLMQSGLVTDLGKANRMFKVVRSGSSKDFLKTSKHLSEYIRYVINERNTSVWIAQRNGRTKDGDDKTNHTVLKMLSLSGAKDMQQNFGGLNIVPMAISYEWETCIAQKVRELYLSENHPYIKEDGEDFRSIIEGILSPKGAVHINLCEPIGVEQLKPLEGLDRNEATYTLAHTIDSRIYEGYKLFKSNYIAYDMLYNKFRFTDKYTQDEYKAFAAGMNKILEPWKENLLPLMNLYLKIYSNPVENALGL